MKKIMVILSSVIVILLLTGCDANEIFGFFFNLNSYTDRPIPSTNEIVMPPYSKITFYSKNGTFVIRSGKGLKRSYSWEKYTGYISMNPRTYRWYGSMGLYCPGGGYHWPDLSGIRRCTAEEAQIQLSSVNDIYKFIKEIMVHDDYSYAYTDDGLLVGWRKEMGKSGEYCGLMDVQVWQIFINGEKPTRLKGSNNKLITIEKLNNIEIKRMNNNENQNIGT